MSNCLLSQPSHPHRAQWAGWSVHQPMTVIGLMSGTSVDAIDACAVELWASESYQLQFQVLGTSTKEIPAHIRERLLACMRDEPVMLKELSALNTVMGNLFADTVYLLLDQLQLPADQVACIGSHGQTVYHQPPMAKGMAGHTLQIGEPSVIAEKTGILTVADFRPRDMAVAGQGAPLVCFADQLLFQLSDAGRCIQNIGGIANVTVLPPAISTNGPLTPMAFDTGPGNMLIDAAMTHFFQKPYDANGQVAASGTVDKALLAELMAHAYLQDEPPKSTGRELFGQQYFQHLVSMHPHVSAETWVATLTRFTAESIADAYARFIPTALNLQEVIVGGGGVYNPTLMQWLAEAFQARELSIKLSTHTDYGIDDKYKEALAFAVLAWAAVLGIPNNVPSCTGAIRPVVMGKILM